MAGILFEDIFDVKDIDPEGKKFDRVSRLHCESESFKMDLILDVNIQIYPVDLVGGLKAGMGFVLNLPGWLLATTPRSPVTAAALAVPRPSHCSSALSSQGTNSAWSSPAPSTKTAPWMMASITPRMTGRPGQTSSST
ncbi:DNA-directed RNA polymerases I, II, and III subunit RPABC3 isoform 3-T3 [Leptosomus discolor]